MKQKLIHALCALVLTTLTGCVAFVFVGCSSTKVKVSPDGSWSVDVSSDCLKRELQSFRAKKDGNGTVEVEFNGYKHDTSEELAKNAAEFWHGVGILGRLAGTVFNPAVSSVPLSEEAADPQAVASLVKAQAEAKAILAKAKAEAAAIKAQTGGATNVTASAEAK